MSALLASLETMPAVSAPIRAVLSLFALLDGCCEGDMYLMLNQAGIECERAQRWTRTEVAAVRRELVAMGIMQIDTLQSMHPALRHALAEEAARQPELVRAVRDVAQIPRDTIRRCMPGLLLRVAVYARDMRPFAALSPHGLAETFSGQFVHEPFDAAWFAARPANIRSAIFANHIKRFMEQSFVAPAMEHTLRAWRNKDIAVSVLNYPDITTFRLLTGDDEGALADAHTLIANGQSSMADLQLGLRAFLLGNADDAQTYILSARKELRRRFGKRTWQVDGIHGLVLQAARLFSGNVEARRIQMEESHKAYIDAVAGSKGFLALQALNEGCAGDRGLANVWSEHAKFMPKADIFSEILALTAEVGLALEVTEERYKEIQALHTTLTGISPVLARMVADILREANTQKASQWVRTTEKTYPPDLTLLSAQNESWSIRLDTLEALLCNPCASAPDKERRLVWLVDLDNCLIKPMEQLRGKNGSWSAGRAVALRRLQEERENFDWLTEQDERALASIESSRNWHYGSGYTLNAERALPILVGHPLVFDMTTRAPVKLEKGEAELVLSEASSGQFYLRLSVPSRGRRLEIVPKGHNVYQVYRLPAEVSELASLLGKNGLLLPAKAMGRVLEFTRKSSSIPLRTEIKTEEMEADATPVVQARCVSGALTLRLRVRPFKRADTQAFLPGEGTQRPLASFEGTPVRVQRDFAKEIERAGALIRSCSALLVEEDGEWRFDTPEESLAALEQLGASPVVHRMEWPEGASMRLVANLDTDQAHVQVRRATGKDGIDWFALEGGVHFSVDGERRVLGLSALLAHLDDAGGRFVPLGDGAFVALTEQLRRQLERLRHISIPGKKGHEEHRVHALSAGNLDEACEGLHIETDDAWQQTIQRLRAAQTLHPEVPVTLQAQLRDYQYEGFVWMSRLAAWGAGACLADDMGLGKTVQTIAVMLCQARLGPCIVVAPTSVCANWERELERFAPSLTVHRLGSTERVAQINALRAGDVLVVGYGLLALEPALARKAWQMAVFDEAQAMKNAATKRAKAGQALRAQFRVALTGTPIENRVDDLWSLFHIINPGLLGTQEAFRKRFEKQQAGASRSLRRLTQPFILRRLKSHVLHELPERTEQTLFVEPSEQEQALYEAIRRRAVEALAAQNDEGAGARRMHILAQLTRLRLACCHPSLARVQGEDPIAFAGEGAKLARFLELLDGLLPGGHKVLAFSQFVGHLELVRAALEARGVAFQYLDGSTPEKERSRRVAAFQAGEGDVFLISLRAGGLGLNLTAADYVVLLDPWWNPAVEDQASDRAHRMGQRRPVTVYRLVAARSVEEKILRLHQDKRELAATFLDGTDKANSLTNEELLALFDM